MSNRSTSLQVDTQGGETRCSSKNSTSGKSEGGQDIALRATFAAKLTTSLMHESDESMDEEGDDVHLDRTHSGSRSNVVASLEQAVTMTLAEAKRNRKATCRSDAEDSDTSSDESDCDIREAVETMQTCLHQGNNLATLAGLLTTNTFSMEDERIEQLMGGGDVPIRVRQLVCNHIMTAIDEIWAQFGGLLVEKLGSFEKAFAWLDQDGSGSMDRGEFVAAYVTLHVEDNVELSPRASRRRSRKLATSRLPRQSVSRQSVGTVVSMSSLPATRRNTQITEGGSTRRNTQVTDGGSQDSKPDATQDPMQLRRMLLRGDAEFLFHMLHTGERGLIYGDEDDTDLTVSMEHLVMRVAGLSERTMEHLRECVLVECSSLPGAFQEFTSGSKLQMTLQEFSSMYQKICRPTPVRLSLMLGEAEKSRERGLLHPSRFSPCPSSGGLSNINEDDEKDALSRLKARPPQDQEDKLHRTACRIFKGIDLDGSGALSIDELRHALAPYAPATSFSTFRRRLLLQHSSFDQFISQLPPGGIGNPEELELFAFDLDLNANDAQHFAEKMGLVQRTMLGLDVYNHPEMPTDGFSIEEFAIVLFLAKPDGAPAEDLFKKFSRAERDKDLSFRDFTECVGQLMQLKSLVSHAANAANYAKAQQRRGRAGEPKRGPRSTISIAAAVPTLTTPRSETQPACRAKELHIVYELLERDHRRVTVNVLQEALTNISDVLAIDQCTYQPGSHIVCRVRLSSEMQKRCRERPFVAIVPERLRAFENGSGGGRTQYFLDSMQVVDLGQLGIKIYELPRTATGLPKRDSWLRICVPSSLPCGERYEIRIFSSGNGVEPGKQVGRSVGLDLTMPRPEPPLVDTMILDTNTKQTSVVLHWEPPTGNFSHSPIKNFVVHVEPLLHRHEFIVDPRTFRRSQESLASTLDENSFHQIVVWSPKTKGFVKKLSYRIHGLHRGVPYKFGIQCVHGHPDDPEKQIRGGQSELCEEVAMPLFNTTHAPGQPSVIQLASGALELSWSAPHNEDCDTCRIFQYMVQYRLSVTTEVADKSTKMENDGSEDDDDDDSSLCSARSANDVRNLAWTNIADHEVFIAQPEAGQNSEAPHSILCRIAELLPLETFATGEHEFRVAALSNAGSSPWSVPSKPMVISNSQLAETMLPPPPQQLEILEVCGSKVHGKYECRSHCLLRWAQPANFHKMYGSPQYMIRLRNVTQDGDWVAAGYFSLRTEELCKKSEESTRRSSFMCRPSEIEAIVRGLERFPSDATLGIQVEVSTMGGRSRAETTIMPVEVPPQLPPEAAPEIIRVHELLHEPPMWELRWTAIFQQDSSEVVRYVVQAQHSATQHPPNWGSFYTVQNSCMSAPTQEGENVTCFIRHIGPDGLYRFRVHSLSADGSVSRPSPVSLETVGSCAHQSKREVSPQSKTHLKPRKPRDLTIVTAEAGWCEVSWEQRVPIGGAGPTSYFAEECWEDGNEPSWRPVRSMYVSFDEALALAQGKECQVVRAAIFFEQDLQAQEKMQCPRWRVRVRAEGSEWSAASQWQSMGGHDVPQQVVDLSVVTTEEKYLLLEWTVPESESSGLQFDLEMQVQRNRRAAKSRDWTRIPGYIMPVSRDDLSPSKCSSSCRVRAIIERQKVVELEKGCALGEIRFRIRSRNNAGVAGLPSEASDWVPIQTVLASVPAPEDLRIVGHGRILMQGELGVLCDSQFVRLEWKIPDDPTNGDALPDASYKVEIENVENGLWDSAIQVFQQLDFDSGVGVAIVVLHSSHMRDRACFRVAASLKPPRGFDTYYPLVSYSEPCNNLSGEIQQVALSPMLSIVKPSVLSFRFLLPVLVAHMSSSVVAEIQRVRIDEVLPTGELSDARDEEYQSLGEHHVLWQMSSLLVENVGQSGAEECRLDRYSHASRDEKLLCPCEGIVYLGDNAQLSPGDRVCIRLRLCSSGVGQILQDTFSQPSPLLEVEDNFKNLGSITIEYPAWTSILPIGGHVCFEPRVLVGNEIMLGKGIHYDDEPVSNRVESSTLLFQVANGDLPGGLELDSHSGKIYGSPADFHSFNCFSVQVVATTSWLSASKTCIAAGANSTVSLACAAIEGVAHGALRHVLQDSSLLQSLQTNGIVEKLGIFLKPELFPLFTSLEATFEDSAVLATTINMLSRMLQLPDEVKSLAAELEEQVLIDRLCNNFGPNSESCESDFESIRSENRAGLDDESSDSDNNDMAIRSSAREEGESEEAGLQTNQDNEEPSGKRASGIGISGLHLPPAPLQRRSTESQDLDDDFQELPDDPNAESPLLHSMSEPLQRRGQGSSSTLLDVKRLSQVRNQETRRWSYDPSTSPADSSKKTRRKSNHPGRKTVKPSLVYGSSHSDRSHGGDSPDPDTIVPKSPRRSPDLDPAIPKSPRKSRRTFVDQTPKRRVEIQYPSLTPLWPAFADVEFLPFVNFVSASSNDEAFYSTMNSFYSDDSLLVQPGQLKFTIEPPLPANVMLDENTGVIRGSPLIENVVGSQCTVTARWTKSGDLAGTCSFGFAVVSSDLANLCNHAYLSQEPPAFRPPSIAAGAPIDISSRYSSECNAEEKASQEEALLQKSDQAICPTDFIRDYARPALRPSTPGYFMVEAAPRAQTPLAPRAQTPLDSHMPAALLNRVATSSERRCPVRPSSSLAWISTRNRPASRSAITNRQTESPWRNPSSPVPTNPGGRSFSRNWAVDSSMPKSRTSVFPLGPPLKDRDITAKMALLVGQVAPTSLSAR